MAILKFKGIGQVDKRFCRVCGCTQFHACPGGCYLVTDDLCSKCFHDRFKPMTSGHHGSFIHNKIANETRQEILQEAFANKDKQLIQNFTVEQSLIDKIHEKFSHIKPK
jgi:hypothetical protein